MKLSLRLVLAAFAALPAMHGCYTYVPVDTSTAPPVGERVAFDITDRGRVALAERLGPGVLRVEGSLQQFDSGDYVLSVWGLANASEGTVRWSGETVRINRDYVGSVRLRQLDKSRTYLTFGAAAVGVYVLVATQDLLGFGFDSNTDVEPPPPASAIIWSWK